MCVGKTEQAHRTEVWEVDFIILLGLNLLPERLRDGKSINSDRARGGESAGRGPDLIW